MSPLVTPPLKGSTPSHGSFTSLVSYACLPACRSMTEALMCSDWLTDWLKSNLRQASSLWFATWLFAQTTTVKRMKFGKVARMKFEMNEHTGYLSKRSPLRFCRLAKISADGNNANIGFDWSEIEGCLFFFYVSNRNCDSHGDEELVSVSASRGSLPPSLFSFSPLFFNNNIRLFILKKNIFIELQ